MSEKFGFIFYLWLTLYLIIIAVKFILSHLNISYLKKHGATVPEEFTGYIDENLLKKMTDYTARQSSFGSVVSIASAVVVILVVATGFMSGLVSWIHSLGLPIVLSGLIFFFIISLIDGIAGIPFDLYENFVIERKFGFSTTTLRIWLSDLLKGAVVSILIMIIALGGLLLLISATKAWWLWVWIFFIGLQLLLTIIYPILIAPLFNKFVPLKNSDLAEDIGRLVEKAGLKVTGIFKVDAGKRSKHTNAYFTGLGSSKRIVLYDTLIDTHTKEEILAVLAHELGHWKLGHIKKQLIVMSLLSLIASYLAYRIVILPEIYSSFKIEGMPVYAGLFILSLLAAPVLFMLTPVKSIISRRFEYQADNFSKNLTGKSGPLIEALKRLAKDNLSNLYPHPFFAWFYYSHPVLIERIKHLKEF